ncbi:hypothetical protein TIFTF001_047920 [Ficus carica]|uniref:CRM domain-containing protein n=1 Tax=Ficus carica TaxID=3494 RepID=A0AA87ZAM6_FICCA|nr:hypothetical protein TIFTF001_047920 [Ficus carica]
MAEKTLPEHELRRLRNVSLRMLERIKVGARGITQALVDNIHEKWKLDEVVKLKFEEPLSQNMKRTHEILETLCRKQGNGKTMLSCPHFALGKNRELQGLAKAMVKLLEKSAIAKIAIKRGVQNTCNERMAEELKRLTGGTLLSRNKDFIVFYRGNDFLPPVVVESLKERKKLRDHQQDEEERVRQMAPAFIHSKSQACIDPLVAGTLAETMAATARWGNQPSTVDVEKMMKDSTLARHVSISRNLERKLALAKGNLKKAEKAIAKVQQNLDPSDLPNDLETITDEERFLFRKMGLRMEPFLLLGRRGLYSGTIENMHLHWKFRELVKIIVKGKSFEHVKQIAISLEAESGGVLVSIDKTLKGYAIIVYRGKNYQSPLKIRPQNLLTRRQALARSIELQRREALRHHILDLQERIGLLKSELEESRNGKTVDNEETSPLTADNSFSDDEATEDDSEEESLAMYDSGDEGNAHEELKQFRTLPFKPDGSRPRTIGFRKMKPIIPFIMPLNILSSIRSHSVGRDGK